MEKETKYKVGDVLRIRNWDDMKAEFGGSHSRINCPYRVAFVEDMKPFCGQIVTVDRIGYQGYDRYFFVEETKYHTNSPLGGWIFTDAMLEYSVKDIEIEPIDASEIDKILFL